MKTKIKNESINLKLSFNLLVSVGLVVVDCVVSGVVDFAEKKN